MSQNLSQTQSQMSREDMLRELELLPVWQLRQPLPTLYKVEALAADKSVLVVAEQVLKEQEPLATERPMKEVVVAESAVLEPSITQPLIPESASPEPSVPETAVLETPVSQQMEVVESIEEVAVDGPVLQQSQPLPLRLLLSEDSHYAFLIEPYAAEYDAQQVEALLKNMMRAMQASCRVDVTDGADKIFAMHAPKLIISFGAVPANQLSGNTHTLDEWRHIQQDSPSFYEQMPLIVTYHPAHLLANSADKAFAWRDLCAAIKLVQSL
jgi:DNA polymerase